MAMVVVACCLNTNTTNTINQATTTHMLPGAEKEEPSTSNGSSGVLWKKLTPHNGYGSCGVCCLAAKTTNKILVAVVSGNPHASRCKKGEQLTCHGSGDIT